MTILFETVKLLFFFLTVFLAFLFFKGQAIFSSGTIHDLHTILTPAYLIFVGLLLAYILALTLDRPENTHTQTNKLYIRMFLVGLAIGILLALIYIFA